MPRSTTSRQRFRTRSRRDPGQDPHWQDVQSSANWLHLRPVPTRGTPRQVTASHEKSLPRTTSLRLTREVSASHEKSPPRTTNPALTGAWAQMHGTSTTTDAHGGMVPDAMLVQQLAAMHASRFDKSLNAGLTGCAAITSPSLPTLPHASSARGTQAPSTMCTSQDLGSGVAGYESAQAD
jgi:hypothetical protein